MANNIDIKKITGDIEALNKSIRYTSNIMSDLIKKQDKLNKELSNAKGLKQVNDNLNKSKKTQNDIEKESEKLTKKKNSLIAKQAPALKELTKETIKQNEKVKEQNRLYREQAKQELGIKKRNSLFKSMTKSILAASAAMLSFRAAFNVVKNNLKTIANFERGMNKVRAVAGATAKEFKTLQKNAKDLGSTTSRTALQVAGLQLEFSKLGFSTKEILAATEATIQLSIAAGSDLANSAIVAASTVRGFGLSAQETQRVVDVMAESFASSALDLEKFKTGMAIAAPVAKSFGKDIEFTTARMSILADAGLDASMAGTSLRNIFLELSKRGLTWDEGLEKINTSTNKNVTALNLFGKRGATAALILADNIEKATALEKAYDNASGAAKRMADIMEDDLIGDVDRLSSKWELFVLNLNKGEGKITNFFRDAVKLVTRLVGKMDELNMTDKERKDNLVQEEINRSTVRFIKLLEDQLKLEDDADKKKELRAKMVQDEIDSVQRLLDETIKLEKVTDDTATLFVLEREIKLYEGIIDNLKQLLPIQKEVKKENNKGSKERIDNLDKIENEHYKREQAITDFIKQQLKERLGDQEKYTVGLSDELLERYEDNKKYLQKLKDDEDKADEYKKRVRDEFISSASKTGNVLFDLAQSNRDRELDAIQNNYAAQIEAAEGNTELQEKLAEKLADEQKRINREQAIADRNQALFNVAISQIESAARSAEIGFPQAIPFIVAAASFGAAQTAAILSQPIPGFFTGTESAPEGLAYVAEKGRELIESNGNMYLAEKEQLVNFGGGEKVYNNADTERMLNAAIYKDIAVNGNEGVESRLDSLLHEIKNQPKEVTVFDDNGIQRYLQNGNSKTIYLNKKARK